MTVEREALFTLREQSDVWKGWGEMVEKLWGSCGERDEKKSRACQFHKEVKLKREIGFILTAKWAPEGLEWQDTSSENQRERTSSSLFICLPSISMINTGEKRRPYHAFPLQGSRLNVKRLFDSLVKCLPRSAEY